MGRYKGKFAVSLSLSHTHTHTHPCAHTHTRTPMYLHTANNARQTQEKQQPIMLSCYCFLFLFFLLSVFKQHSEYEKFDFQLSWLQRTPTKRKQKTSTSYTQCSSVFLPSPGLQHAFPGSLHQSSELTLQFGLFPVNQRKQPNFKKGQRTALTTLCYRYQILWTYHVYAIACLLSLTSAHTCALFPKEMQFSIYKIMPHVPNNDD